MFSYAMTKANEGRAHAKPVMPAKQVINQIEDHLERIDNALARMAIQYRGNGDKALKSRMRHLVDQRNKYLAMVR